MTVERENINRKRIVYSCCTVVEVLIVVVK